VSDCSPPIPPEEDVNVPKLVPPAPGGTKLQTDAYAGVARTTRFEVDAVGAMQRGLKEYLEQVQSTQAGAVVRFRQVADTWAEPNDEADYPAAAVLIEGIPEYDAHNLSPRIYDGPTGDFMPDGTVVEKSTEVVAMLRVVAHCANPGQRDVIARLLEVSLKPVPWMYGFRLDLPHYGGQRATYLPMRADYKDDAALARHNLRPIEVVVEARVSEVIPRTLPAFQPKFAPDVQDSSDPPATLPPGVPPG
jgi:hypothetical protein